MTDFWHSCGHHFLDRVGEEIGRYPDYHVLFARCLDMEGWNYRAGIALLPCPPWLHLCAQLIWQ